MIQFLLAFVVGGLICVIGQILMDVFKMTPAHMTVTLVVTGAILAAWASTSPDRIRRGGSFRPH